jgi:hypothetical protein
VHLKKVKKLCKRHPDKPKPRKILDSLSSDSLTEMEVSLESNEDKERYELYNPEVDKKKEIIEEEKKRGKERKKKGIRPPTPKKEGEVLVSQFGRPQFKETQDIDVGKEEESDEEEEKKVEYQTPVTSQNLLGYNTAASLMARPISPERQAINPIEESKGRLFMPREDTDEPPVRPQRNPNAPTPHTPSQHNPEMTAAQFESGFKSAAEMDAKRFQK